MEAASQSECDLKGVKMLKSVLFASAAATLALCASAQAMPLSGNLGGGSSPSVTLVAGGCGVGWHPTPVGCRPNGGPVVVAPVVVAPVPYWRGPGWRFYNGCWRGPRGGIHCG
jgi:hypothetical protein